MLVQELHRIQHEHGFLPEHELRVLADRTKTPLYRLQELISFFPHFRSTAPPKVSVQVCHDMACHQRRSDLLKSELEKLTASSNAIRVSYVSCLGRCDRPVAALINDELFVARSARELASIAEKTLQDKLPPHDTDRAYPVHSNQPWKINFYPGQSTYQAIREYIASPSPERIFKTLKDGDLRGMGGAGVPAEKKWSDVNKARGDEKYVVCNGDESEPSTFKDRELLLRTPHLVLEGVILAGLVTGATRGFIYIRHEYAEQIAIMRRTILEAEALGCCGTNILGGERSFPVEVFVSPGGYICGEQSALIEAMEDRRGQPRNKPPQLETNGLYDKPTLVSNVETFAWAPAIAVHGGAWYREQGVRGCKGLRFFSICGDVLRPGVFEVPCGILLRELIELAGGLSGKLKAFAPSGPSGGFLPARLPAKQMARDWQKKFPALAASVELACDGCLDILDLPLDLQCFRDLGLSIGAGMAVYNDQHDMTQEALNCVEFFRNESCGKCVPCRIGSEKAAGLAHDLVNDKLNRTQLADEQLLINELAQTMELTSICGLGVVAAKPLQSALQNFQADVDRHLC